MTLAASLYSRFLNLTLRNSNCSALALVPIMFESLFLNAVKIVSSYPGTPSTEITEFAAKYDEIPVSLTISLGECISFNGI